jgi:hypothetical protein
LGIFSLASLRGGLDDTSPPTGLADDACTIAENVEFVNSTLGERRKGCVEISLPSSVTADLDFDAVTWMYRHVAANLETSAELWLLAQSLSATDNILVRRNQSGWATITQIDAITSTTSRGHAMSAQTLHGKLFLAHKSGVDRLHVYDGTDLRRTGLAEPAAPAVANTGAGAYTGTRYFRVRYARVSGSTVILRSEPSDVTTFVPSGAGASARISKPAAISEGETHWEVEASLDNATFYRITRIATTNATYDDSTVYATGYAAGNTLSEPVGDYTLIPSGKLLSADQDRLIIAGSWETAAEASRVRWTPVYASLGAGNDERIVESADDFVDLDGYEGGEITALSKASNGYLYAFKRSHIYKLVRTGTGYEAFCITKSRGALPGSLIEAIDQAGNPSLYFLDPSYGPNRIGATGLQWCGRDIQTLWKRVNVNAKIPCHGVYYNDKRQLHYWLAVDGSDYPNQKIVLHVNEVRDSDEGGRRGWVTVTKNSRIATAHCSVMFSDNIDTTDPRSFALVPLIGKEKWTVGVSTIRNYVQRCDTAFKDAHTTGDTGSVYYGRLKSKAFALGQAGLLSQHEVKAGVLLAKSVPTPDGYVYIQAIKDFGLDARIAKAELRPMLGEDQVIKVLDDLGFAELRTVQIELGDLDTNISPTSEWELNQLQLSVTSGQKV